MAPECARGQVHTLKTEQALQTQQASHLGERQAGHSPLSRQVHAEHEQVLEAMRQRDPELARSRAQTHLRKASERLGLDTSAFTRKTAR